jgi:hypothetical protein
MRGHVVALATVALVVVACGDDDGYGGDSASGQTDSVDTEVDPTGVDDGGDGGGEGAVIDPGDGGSYTVEIDPANFTSVVDNPFFPLAPGTKWVYEETTGDETEINTTEVLDETRTVMGVETIVVHDVVATEDGEVVEDTYDWYAQDADGNVWYFGEDTTAFEDGQESKEGSWEAGVDGALPGIVMYADPQVSETGYRQEYLAGVAEDMGQVIEVGAAVETPYGAFDDTVRTTDWTPLEPDVIEQKTYARGIGFVHEVMVQGPDTGATAVLVEYTTGGS